MFYILNPDEVDIQDQEEIALDANENNGDETLDSTYTNRLNIPYPEQEYGLSDYGVGE